MTDAQNRSKQTVDWVSYFLIIALMALTGFEFFYRAQDLLLLPVFAVAAFYFYKRGYKLNQSLLSIIIPFFTLSLLQTILGYNKNILTTAFLLISFVMYAFIAKITGPKFILLFIKLVLFFSVISLVFFTLTYVEPFMALITNNIAPLFKSLGAKSDDYVLGTENRNIIIYNFKNYASSYNRNSGPFWEPGMFVVFVNVALLFNLVIFKKLFAKRNIILIVTIITTFSTTGYIAFLFILLIYTIFYSNSKLKFLYLSLLFVISFYIANLDIIKDKIQNQYSDTSGISRFGATLVHYQVITEFPFTGVGDGASRYILNLTDAESTANGLTFVFVKYGVLLGIAYYIMLCRGCISIMDIYTDKKIMGYCFFALLLILAFSQDITVRHFYFFIIVWGTIVVKPKLFKSDVFKSKMLKQRNAF
jgi:hypothetical protein